MLREVIEGDMTFRQAASTSGMGREQSSADPAVALWRVVGALTPTQTRSFAREIELLAASTAPQRPDGRPISRVPEGVRPRHSNWCHSQHGEVCGCAPRWEAWVYSRRDRAKVRKSFAEYWEAKAWRHEQLKLASNGLLFAPSRRTLSELGVLWIALAQQGKIRNRSGRRYKPSALRTIETDLRLHLTPSLGDKPMAAIIRRDLQRLVGGWLDEGFSPSKIRSIVNALRVLWRDFDLLTDSDNELLADPTQGLRLPSGGGRHERIASPSEARRLIDALKHGDRALWATAIYAGLRHGELRALQVRDVDLQRCRILVRRGWDQYEGEIDPKSESGTRPAVITEPLRRTLAQHLKRTGRKDSDLVFGKNPTRPFNGTTISKRAHDAWAVARQREDQENSRPPAERIRPIGLQECRHSAVSQMLDAGIPIEKVSKFIGHASITITIDRYGHLLPGGETEALALLDSYHSRY
jgi:integrase